MSQESAQKSANPTSNPAPCVLSAHNVSYSIDGHRIIHDVSLQIAEQSMTAIVGINGAGKSTLLRILAGITAPSAGDVQLNGQSLRSMSAKARTRMLSFAAQDESPPAEMSIRGFVALGRLPYQRLFSRYSARDHAIVEASIARVGLTELQQRQCGELSGGQRRATVLARALAQTAPLLLLDEPTNHLDVAHQQQMLRLARDSDACVVAAVHDLDLVMAYFDRVIVLHDGIIYADGAPQEVLTPRVVADVFGVEAEHVCAAGRSTVHLIIEGETANRRGANQIIKH